MEGGASCKEPACQYRRHKRWGLIPGKEDLRRRQWHPTPVLLPGKSHGLSAEEGVGTLGRGRVGGGDNRLPKSRWYQQLLRERVQSAGEES